MDERSDLLLRLGLSLNELGVQIKLRQERAKEFLSQGYSYDSPELIRLAKEYHLLQCQFASLEAQFKEGKGRPT